MHPYKHIERSIAKYIIDHYSNVIEVGVGSNFETAREIAAAGCQIFCTDIKDVSNRSGVHLIIDDIFNPRDGLYDRAELIFAIRPGIEMVPALLALAKRINSDLLVYHPGDELYGDGGTIIDCGVALHRYHTKKQF